MTIAVLRTFIETDLSDTALTVVLAAADEELTLAVGPDTEMVEERDMHGEVNLWLERPTSDVSEITLTADDGTITTLDDDDYEIHVSGMRIKRLATGPNPETGWTSKVRVTYTPSDLNRRNSALAQLVELELAFRPGAKSEGIGDHSRTMQDYNAEKARIINSAQSRSFA